jgi:hypothetical protein
MMRQRFLPSLLGMLALMLLGGTGGLARAGYMEMKAPLRPAPSLLLKEGGLDSEEAEMGSTLAHHDPEPAPADRNAGEEWLRSPLPGLDPSPESASGMSSSSTGTGSGGFGPQAGFGSRPPVPALERGGLLYVHEVCRRPPPFASRLFRPPRVV